ncbi:MAG: hypothetical protein K9L70_11355 [Thiohalocapsa sp.]|nr:hypothetical protein [Thiohalocapsa sp.]
MQQLSRHREELTFPLLDPRALAAVLPLSVDEEPAWLQDTDHDAEIVQLECKLRRALNGEDGDAEDVPSAAAQPAALRLQVRAFFQTLPRWVVKRLAEADGHAPTALLRAVMEAAPAAIDALLALPIEPASAGAWGLDAFPHLASDAARLREGLRPPAPGGWTHGAPGTGKTELARALASAAGLTAYQVRSDDGFGLKTPGTGWAWNMSM